ncbi:oxamate carbamoyltransferase subunit AllH family protein [Cellulomonas wangsupingiae]|uniref:DUF2877 domain-containing protein n=1 Tax=Cellulomonas wangsupingiae TaxID=2968085 RepID=A0ABY5K7U3_9CELL|nr:DUF2877 domain-containing protein [Cellulomonas wangsupingiae]MCC2335343.1 DUF2877 domain-containing protein [Cellulomonas wangsupingiae]UUI66522.1 DUF2877 domain-containing protein [Cellulomonas wangsupingiae]
MTNRCISGVGPARLATDAPVPDVLVTARVVHVGRTSVVLRTADGTLVPVTSAAHGLVPGGVCLAAAAGDPGPALRAVAGAAPNRDLWLTSLQGAPRVDLVVPKGAVDAGAARALLTGALVAASSGGGRGVMDPGPARRGARTLVGAAAGDDPRGVRAVLHRLVGVGPGSTPSGDDAVVGVLAGLDRRDDAAAARAGAAIRRALPAVLHRTTSLSRHALAAALRGQVAERVQLLVAATADAALVPGALASARTWGASSGLDLAAGVGAGALGDAAAAHPPARPADEHRRTA